MKKEGSATSAFNIPYVIKKSAEQKILAVVKIKYTLTKLDPFFIFFSKTSSLKYENEKKNMIAKEYHPSLFNSTFNKTSDNIKIKNKKRVKKNINLNFLFIFFFIAFFFLICRGWFYFIITYKAASCRLL